MVYEIYFEPKGAVWRISITVFFLYFFPVRKVVQSRLSDTDAAPMDFETFEAADRYTKRVGLDQAYLRRNRGKEYTTQLQGGMVHGTSS